MAAKPSEKTILQTYSLNELLDLIKDKAKMDAEEQLNSAREFLNNAAKAMGGAFETTAASVSSTEKSGRGRGRPKQSSKVARGGKKVPLGQLIQEVLGSEPMKIEEIMTALKEHGYKSKSKDPRRVLYLELKKQVESNTIEKVGRGMYTIR